jgi:3alpha(or 20beta)-hydroxysteroid dehydrogenase
MIDLTGKVALVTGGAGATGAAHGRVFVAAGAAVLLTDVQDAAGDVVVSELGEAGAYLRHDVTSEQGWRDAVAYAVDRLGGLDILVNNAGICPVASIDRMSAASFTEVLSVNTLGPFLGIQAAARVMKPGSVIINIASIDGLRGVAGLAAYGASKAALKTLSKTAALELAPKGISVLCLHPGGIDTPMMYEAGNKLMELAGVPADQADIGAALQSMIPLGRVARPEEIAEWSAFLAARGAATATGADFVIDGGYTAGGNAGI